MPYVGDGVGFQSARKRRWEDDHDSNIYRIYNPEKQQQPDFYFLNRTPDFSAARKILPLSSKRARITPEDDSPHHQSPSSLVPTQRRRLSQQKSFQDQPELGNRVSVPPSAALLAPCYICHRRPTKKSDLDSFAECQGCGERACFVCIRECHGWNADDSMSVLSEQEVLSRSFHMYDADNMDPEQRVGHHGHLADESSNIQKLDRHCRTAGKNAKGWAASGHRSVVCSRCCVERGREGEVVCLGCLSSMAGA